MFDVSATMKRPCLLFFFRSSSLYFFRPLFFVVEAEESDSNIYIYVKDAVQPVNAFSIAS